jgi:hypothetical protein
MSVSRFIICIFFLSTSLYICMSARFIAVTMVSYVYVRKEVGFWVLISGIGQELRGRVLLESIPRSEN